MHVIGTAGHVDHGKSTLVEGLTGTNPDRLKEEQQREMTIDLGFAWLTLPDGEEIGIIDVPGHRDFIDNMLAGVGGIDAALLVIAADEGIMPQTREHLAILDLLQIQTGIVVLTKIDLVDDPEWLKLVELDIRKLLEGTVLKNAPIQHVSSVTHAGFPDLLQKLGSLLRDIPPRTNQGRPRLPVDRVFSIAGFGTVVTGTLIDGMLISGEEVEILPSGIQGRIRGLQTYKREEKNAIPGSRTAINISGLDLKQIQRGNVVTHPGKYQVTQRLDLSFRMLPGVSSPLRHRTEVKFYIAASETVGEIRLLGEEFLNPGESGWLQLELRSPVVAVRGDRYILRRPSPPETIGGGTVVDPQPKGRHKRFDKSIIQSLKALAQGSPSQILLQASLALGPARVKDVISRSGLESSVAETALQELIDKKQCLQLDDLLIPDIQWSQFKDAAVTELSSYHQSYPLRHGIPREELKSRLKVPPHIFNLILARMAAEGILIEGSKWAALPEHKVSYSPFQLVKVENLLGLFTANPTTPPSVKDCLAEVGEDVLNALKESGELIAVSDEIIFRRTDYEAMVGQIQQKLVHNGTVSMAEVRDLLNTSRKYVQPLLEHLDAIGVTVREGDTRHLRS
jgi:selenocysteine-specific elongation factor SelB